MWIYNPFAITSLRLFLLLLFLLPGFGALAKPDRDATISVGSVITATKSCSGAAWTSSSGRFSFGFYAVDTKFSIGIQLVTNITTVIWTYDRDGDLLPEGTKLQLTEDGLRLPSPAGDRTVSNLTTANGAKLASAAMEDSGDFVILDVNNQIMWQTFDYPTDTVVSGQILRSGNKLVSSVSATNHSSGRFQLVMQRDGNLVMNPVNTPENGAYDYWATGSNGDGYTAALFSDGDFSMISNVSATHNVTHNSTQVTPLLYIGRIEPDGYFNTFYTEGSRTNFEGSFVIQDDCSIYGACGYNSYCNLNATTGGGSSTNLRCLCLPGFVYNDESKPYTGCYRNFSMGQNAAAAAEHNITFSIAKLTNVSWLDAYDYTDLGTAKDCSDACLRDSNCYAAVFSDQRCRKQRHPFLYAVRSADDPAIAFLKIGSEEPPLPPPPPPPEVIYGVPSNRVLILSAAVASVSIFSFSAAVFFLYIMINRRFIYQKKCRKMKTGLTGGMAPRSFTYRKLVEATENFTHPLGKGGYSTVFKGEVHLGDGESLPIAVKRLDKLWWENERGFRTEMRTAGRAHHRNLVRLLGFCREGSKFLLVYEYMIHGSIAGLIFEPRSDQEKQKARPSWKMRAGMAMDVAQGILYLHEGCESTIIHGDIKPDNALVAEDGTAKIGDLGLAKLLMPRQSETYTRSRGTGMYKAPEWTQGADDPITSKVDVYSYGVLLLELIACRRYLLSEAVDGCHLLSAWAYKSLMESTMEKLVPDKEEEVDKEELKKMVMVALWCVQKAPTTRNSMKEVVRMLGGKTIIPLPPYNFL